MFNTAKRKDGEDVQAWHTRIREYFHRAFVNVGPAAAEKDKRLKDKFTVGIKDVRLTHGLKSDTTYPSKTFTELLVRARELQAANIVCQQNYDVRGSGKVMQLDYSDPEQVAEDSPDTEDSPEVAAVNKRGPGSKPICFHCGKEGHILRDCELHTKSVERILKNPGAWGLQRVPAGQPPAPPRQLPPGRNPTAIRWPVVRRSGGPPRGRGRGFPAWRAAPRPVVRGDRAGWPLPAKVFEMQEQTWDDYGWEDMTDEEYLAYMAEAGDDTYTAPADQEGNGEGRDDP